MKKNKDTTDNQKRFELLKEPQRSVFFFSKISILPSRRIKSGSVGKA